MNKNDNEKLVNEIGKIFGKDIAKGAFIGGAIGGYALFMYWLGMKAGVSRFLYAVDAVMEEVKEES